MSDTRDDAQTPSGSGRRNAPRWSRIIPIALAYGALLIAGFWGGEKLIAFLGYDGDTTGYVINSKAVWIGLAVYTILLAIPFVPGIEISMAMLAAFGGSVALQIYVATVIAFMVSFTIGRRVPTAALCRVLASIGLTGTEQLVRRMQGLDQQERLQLLVESAPIQWVPTLIKYRYVAIALMINMPGNALLGGGGGISLLAGISRLFSPWSFFFAVLIAALPVTLVGVALSKIF
ncbi:MAG: hypothetical protein AAFQ11_01335 [Pseudomonadota bacterium]